MEIYIMVLLHVHLKDYLLCIYWVIDSIAEELDPMILSLVAVPGILVFEQVIGEGAVWVSADIWL
jgi:hypothetical protein